MAPYFEQLTIDGELVAQANIHNHCGQLFEGMTEPGRHTILIQNKRCCCLVFEI